MVSADAAERCAVLVETSGDGCRAAQLAHAMATRSMRNMSDVSGEVERDDCWRLRVGRPSPRRASASEMSRGVEAACALRVEGRFEADGGWFAF